MGVFALLAIIAPALGAIGIYYISKKVSEERGCTLTAIICGITFFLVCLMYPAIARGYIVELRFYSLLPVVLTLYVDSLGFLLGFISSLLWFMASLYAIEYMKPEHAKTRFNIFSLLSLCGMMGIVFTGNLFSLYIFFELMAILSYVLVIHEETTEAMRAGLKYLFMGIVGGLLLLLAIVATQGVCGTTTLSRAGLAPLRESPYFTWIFWCFIFGFAVKAGMFPVHVWLPDAHPIAPTPASALLSGVMIKAGAYGIVRTIYAVFGPTVLANPATGKFLLILGIITMILGSGCAILQKEIKRLLAFSSIAQIGYVITGAALLSSLGLTGGVLHIFNHALMKGTLFLCAGAIIYKTGLRQLKDLRGIGFRMPLTMICFTLAACSMIGFPPFCGFISKWILAEGALQSASMGIISGAAGIAVVGFLLLSSLLNVVYYGPIVIGAWFGVEHGEHAEEEQGHGAHEHSHEKPHVERADPNWLMLVPMFVLALGTLIFGIYPQFPLNLAKALAHIYFGH
ncbi:MAG: proton-conducting transporter membrane subunit [Actinomycetota bacterium]|nr:proton-conducting transporter membrane subunit [Actinomycetota bacterium]